MLFSILIANYNNSRFLAVAISSIQAQTYPLWEAVVVDDGSVDDFEEVISKFEWDKRIKVFRNDRNRGCGYTKRKCAEHACGSVLAFLDPDDSLHPEALQVMIKAHILRPDCSLIYSTHYICGPDLDAARVADYPKALPPCTPYLLLNDGSIHHFASFKKNSYDTTAGISPSNQRAVDQDLYYKLEEVGNVLFINRPLYYYRIHDGSISNSGNEKAATFSHYSIIEEACIRRIGRLKNGQADSVYWRKKYKIRLLITRIVRSLKSKNWPDFAKNLVKYAASGGAPHIFAYLKKIPQEGLGLFRRSLFSYYEIKA